MRLSTFFLIIILFVVLNGFTSSSHPVYITGYLKTNTKDSKLILDKITVFIKGDNKILAKSVTNRNGRFEISFIPKNEKSFDFYCVGIGSDTLFLQSIKKFESDTPTILFQIPTDYKR